MHLIEFWIQIWFNKTPTKSVVFLSNPYSLLCMWWSWQFSGGFFVQLNGSIHMIIFQTIPISNYAAVTGWGIQILCAAAEI